MWTLRPARGSELELLRDIEREAGRRFEEIGRQDVASQPPRRLTDLRRSMGEGLLWVADDAGAGAVGFALARRLDGSLHLEELSVLPAHGRRGLGAALVRRICELAVELGYPRVTLSTFRDVPWNAPFYERLGFEPVPEDRLPEELAAVRRAESRAGLEPAARVIMERCSG